MAWRKEKAECEGKPLLLCIPNEGKEEKVHVK